MREQTKQQIRDMLVTLGKAEAILDSKIKKKDTDDLYQLFEDMQNSAITIGTTIEKAGSEGTETVSLLEEYCELLWQYMVEEGLKEQFRIARLLAGKRGEINASLEAEIEGRLEIVFLVSQEQSWSHMERFYHMMMETADCYILTEAGGVFGSVNTRRFGEYDFQERKPDLVFVGGLCMEQEESVFELNYDFMEIRENAGIVLYIPYNEDCGKMKEVCCRTPEIIYSDMILVPSREVSDIYVNVMKGLDNGRELIKKIYVLDVLDESKFLSRAFEKKK